MANRSNIAENPIDEFDASASTSQIGHQITTWNLSKVVGRVEEQAMNTDSLCSESFEPGFQLLDVMELICTQNVLYLVYLIY